LSAAQSRNFGIGKFPGFRDSGIPGSRDCNPYLLRSRRYSARQVNLMHIVTFERTYPLYQVTSSIVISGDMIKFCWQTKCTTFNSLHLLI